jgi:hypothetical protein
MEDDLKNEEKNGRQPQKMDCDLKLNLKKIKFIIKPINLKTTSLAVTS